MNCWCKPQTKWRTYSVAQEGIVGPDGAYASIVAIDGVTCTILLDDTSASIVKIDGVYTSIVGPDNAYASMVAIDSVTCIILLDDTSVKNWRKGSPQETRPERENSSLGFITCKHCCNRWCVQVCKNVALHGSRASIVVLDDARADIRCNYSIYASTDGQEPVFD